MRTTVTIDPDVEQILRQAMQDTGQGFKTVLNQAIRRGLAHTVVDRKEPPFVVEARPMGLMPGIDPTRLNQLNDDLEIEAHLEVNRRMAQNPPGAVK